MANPDHPSVDPDEREPVSDDRAEAGEAISEWEVFTADDGEKALRMTPDAVLAAARRHIDSQRAEIDGYKREQDKLIDELAITRVKLAEAIFDRDEADARERSMLAAKCAAEAKLAEVEGERDALRIEMDEMLDGYSKGLYRNWKAAESRLAAALVVVEAARDIVPTVRLTATTPMALAFNRLRDALATLDATAPSQEQR